MGANPSASAILTVLAARGIPATPEVRRVITTCTDISRLEAWLTRATSAASAKEVVRDLDRSPATSRRRKR